VECFRLFFHLSESCPCCGGRETARVNSRCYRHAVWTCLTMAECFLSHFRVNGLLTSRTGFIHSKHYWEWQYGFWTKNLVVWRERLWTLRCSLDPTALRSRFWFLLPETQENNLISSRTYERRMAQKSAVCYSQSGRYIHTKTQSKSSMSPCNWVKQRQIMSTQTQAKKHVLICNKEQSQMKTF